MIEKFKFYGASATMKQIASGEVKSQQQKNEADLEVFRMVFPNMVRQGILYNNKLFNSNPYVGLASQENAFAHLETFIASDAFTINSITPTSEFIHEPLFCIQLKIPVPRPLYKNIFTKPVSDKAKGYVLVNFYAGLCTDFTKLTVKNELIEKALEEMRAKMEKPELEDKFNPDIVISTLLKKLRAERRYQYLHPDLPFNTEVSRQAYYKTPEGYLYRVEVEGYSLVEEVPRVEPVEDVS